MLLTADVLLSSLSRALVPPLAPQVEEDPNHEFPPTTADDPPLSGPRLIEVGIKGPGAHPTLWRRAWRDKILPAVVNFNPDLIMVSAGFDAHRKDVINYRCAQQCERAFNSAQQCVAWLGLAVRDAPALALLAPFTLPGNHACGLWKEACPAKSMFELSWQGCRHACMCLRQHA